MNYEIVKLSLNKKISYDFDFGFGFVFRRLRMDARKITYWLFSRNAALRFTKGAVADNRPRSAADCGALRAGKRSALRMRMPNSSGNGNYAVRLSACCADKAA